MIKEILRRKWARCVLFFLILLPFAQFAWRNRDMPKFGRLHDDGILFASAKSLAAGEGYRIPSLPEKPFQTKFPPLFPLYASIIWKLNPHFPENIPLGTLLCSVVFLPYLGLTWRFFRRGGATPKRTLLLVALLAVNPYLIFYGATLFSDIFFSCWVLATLLAAGHKTVKMAFVAGIAAGCAFLSRTAGIAFLVSIPAAIYWESGFSWRRSWRRGGAFFVGILPAVVGWTLWTRAHMMRSSDPGIPFYTDYLKFQTMNVGFDNLGVVLWKNLGSVVLAMGHMGLPMIFDTAFERSVTAAIAAAMVVGAVRLGRNEIVRSYGLFTLVSLVILLLCGFPSTERYIVPFFPVLLAGLVAEWERVAKEIARSAKDTADGAQRLLAYVWAAALGLVTTGVLAFQLYATFWFLPGLAVQDRAKLADRRQAYSWMAQNLPPSAKVLSYEDPLLYLYTGFPGSFLPYTNRGWYSGDRSEVVDAYRNVVAYCRRRGYDYFYFTLDDLARNDDRDIDKVVQAVRTNRELTPVFAAGFGTLYRVNPSGR